jgi:hypothetical protein
VNAAFDAIEEAREKMAPEEREREDTEADEILRAASHRN